MIGSVAYLAMHTSPLHLPGSGDAGGMNVYLDRLSRTMALKGIDVTVFTRRSDLDTPIVTEIEPGYRVVQIEAGPMHELSRNQLMVLAPEFSGNLISWIDERALRFDIIHSHYWLSGRAGVRLKEHLGVPLANSFHTLGKVKDAVRSPSEPTSSRERLLTEEEVIARSDCVIASTPFEFEDLLEHYAASPERLCVSPPGVDHAMFRPGSREEARERLGFGSERIILYAGRVQAHKGTNVAVQALAQLPDYVKDGSGPTMLHIVGGASGIDGEAERRRCLDTIRDHALEGRVRWFEPVAHPTLADHYRAADVVLVPSRSESFGLVAAEAQACGIPVVASNTGGLPYVINASESGLLVDDNDPDAFGAALRAILDHPTFAERLSQGGVSFSQRFSWDATAIRLMELYEGISA
jgi:D-inositol-3-phosphate glycosyltransferase